MNIQHRTGIVTAVLLCLAASALPASELEEIVNCMPDNATSGGDILDRGFYIDHYPGATLEQVLLRLNTNTEGTYTLRLTARLDTYDGDVIGKAEQTYTFTKADVSVPVLFNFKRRVVSVDSRITFAIEKVSGPGSIFYGFTGGDGCPVTQTEGTSPPLDSHRRDGITTIMYGMTTAPDHTHFAENPRNGETYSGIGMISGWICDAKEVWVEFDLEEMPVDIREPMQVEEREGGVVTVTMDLAYGTGRDDTIGVCGDNDNGYGLLFNWNVLGDGEHTLRIYADGEMLESTTYHVQTVGEEFATGLSGSYYLDDFPQSGQRVRVDWIEGLQQFTITDYLDSDL